MSDHAAAKEFTLRKPVILADNNKIKSITLQEPLAVHLEKAESLSAAENKGVPTTNGIAVNLIALCAGLNAGIIRNLDARDYLKMRGYLNSFLEDSPPTGES